MPVQFSESSQSDRVPKYGMLISPFVTKLVIKFYGDNVDIMQIGSHFSKGYRKLPSDRDI